ncbi:MAG TPA: RnfH family protein [Burkholderiaceae bacterium]|nr:RnfH family protein [Burkholderiaceae bacterium]
MIHVSVVWSSLPGQGCERVLALPEGSRVSDALAQAFGQALGDREGLRASVWGRACAEDAPLRDGDRVELTRGLRVDPKLARRERFSRQGSRGAGLFSKRRPGAKPGY